MSTSSHPMGARDPKNLEHPGGISGHHSIRSSSHRAIPGVRARESLKSSMNAEEKAIRVPRRFIFHRPAKKLQARLKGSSF